MKMVEALFSIFYFLNYFSFFGQYIFGHKKYVLFFRGRGRGEEEGCLNFCLNACFLLSFFFVVGQIQWSFLGFFLGKIPFSISGQR